MKAGPKSAGDTSALPWRPGALTGAPRLARFCQKFITTPKGQGAKHPMRLRPWQVELAGSLLDAPCPQLAVWVVARGAGKSTLTAALALHHVFDSGIEGARAVVVAQDERSSRRLLSTAARMVALNDHLADRVRVYADRIVVERTDSQIIALPGEAHRIEGEDASLAICDEIGVVRRDAFESLLHSTGKRAGSQLLAIGTPSPPSWRELSPLLDLVLDGRANPSPDFALREFSGDISHEVSCEHCWLAANPGLDDLVSREHLRAALPPRSRESEFRRARLAQWVEHDDAAFLPHGLWASLSTGEGVPDGTDVVIALDGSFNADATALMVGTVSAQPHVDVAGLWEPPNEDSGYRVPVLEVEDAIRAAARRWRVVEIIADPFRWTRTLQVLQAEGLPVVEFPHSAGRLTPATNDLLKACVNGELTHSGNPDLARHVGNAVLAEDARGVRLDKSTRHSTRRIDLCACLLMTHSRATWRATRRPTKRKTRSFR